LVSTPAQMPRVLEEAIRAAVGQRGVAVIVVSGDTALREAIEAPAPKVGGLLPGPSIVLPVQGELDRLAAILNASKRVTLLCGSGCAGAHEELLALGDKLKSPMVHALRGKEHVEWNNPYDVGMTGLIGFSSGYYAMKECDTLLMLGTDFPYRQFYPESGVHVAQIDIRPENLGRRAEIELGLVGDVVTTIEALLPLLHEKTDTSHLDDARSDYREARKGLDDLAK